MSLEPQEERWLEDARAELEKAMKRKNWKDAQTIVDTMKERGHREWIPQQRNLTRVIRNSLKL